MLIFSYVLSIVGSLALGLFVFQKRNLNATIRTFSLFTMFTVLWQASSFLTELTEHTSFSVTAIRLGIASGTLMALMFYLFCYSFAHKEPLRSRFSLVLSALSLFFVIASFTDSMVQNGTTFDTPIYGFSYTLNTIFIVLIIGAAIAQLLRKGLIKDKDSRKQIKYIFAGMAVALTVNVLTGFVLINSPVLKYVSWVSPLSILFMVLLFMIAILRHKLFDIKPIVARTVSYVFVTVFITLAYVALAFVAKTFISPLVDIGAYEPISNVVLATALVLVYPYIRSAFDKLSNKIFYRDAYDPQSLIASLNKTLVSTLNVESLIDAAVAVIRKDIKTDFCSVLLTDTNYKNMRVIGDTRGALSITELQSVSNILMNRSERLVYVEDFEGNSYADSELVDIMKNNNIEAVVRLIGTGDEKRDIGFMLLGAKKSGNLYSKQDLGILQIIANELVIAVQNALRYEEIEQFSITLQKKVNDATKELRKSNEKLKALDEAKDEFISMASHQLRTPLTSVKGYLSMLAEGDAGEMNDNQKQFVNQAFISSQRMVYLIADLLNVSRLKTGKFVIEAAPTYLPDVVETEIAQLEETVKSRGLTMHFDKPSSFSTLMLDETKIRQVIMNFTDNAIYYTPSGGTITVALKETDKSVEFTVTDTGLGVPKADQPHLFTKFYRAGNARKARPDGTGLGLFMAKKVVIAQGGSIIFKSTEGKGSTFGFSFPKEQLLAQANK